MRWKSIVRAGIIICTFFIITIECRTNVIATEKKTLFLTPISNDKINKTIKLFLGNFDDGNMVSEEYAAVSQLGETDEVFLTRMLKVPLQKPGTYIVGIPNDASIKEIILDKEHDSVLVNMTQDYQLMNYGSLGEYLALQSLASTVANYYDVHKAVIEIEGQPYCSGHIYFKKNEAISVAQ